MKKNLFSAIAEKLVVEVNNTHNPPFATLNEAPIEVQIHIYRSIVGILSTLQNQEGEGITIPGNAFNPIVGNTFCTHSESFEKLFEFLLHDEKLEGHYAELIGRFTHKIFIPVQCEFEGTTLQDEIEIIAQVFTLLSVQQDQTVLQILQDTCFQRFTEEDLDTCDSIASEILQEYKADQQQPARRRNRRMSTRLTNPDDHKAYTVKSIVKYGLDKEDEETKIVQQLALYFALYSDEVNFIRDVPNSGFDISEHLGMLFTDHSEEIHAYCVELMLAEEDCDLTARKLIGFVNSKLTLIDVMPTLSGKVDYVNHIYEIFQMLRITCQIHERNDILTGMKNIFTISEHEQYSSFIDELNTLNPLHVEEE